MKWAEEGPAKPHILLVEDEQHLAVGISRNLCAEGYEVTAVADGQAGLEAMLTRQFDLAVLDVMLPHKDGFAVCQEARQRGITLPILFLSARASATERVHGLELGADDYVAKPFHLAEFLGRVQALLRRTRGHRSTGSELGTVAWAPTHVQIDLATAELRAADGHFVALGQREAAVLRRLWQGFGEVVSREALLEAAWGQEVMPSSRALEPIIEALRERLEPVPEQPDWLLTIRGIGYCLRQP